MHTPSHTCCINQGSNKFKQVYLCTPPTECMSWDCHKSVLICTNCKFNLSALSLVPSPQEWAKNECLGIIFEMSTHEKPTEDDNRDRDWDEGWECPILRRPGTVGVALARLDDEPNTQRWSIFVINGIKFEFLQGKVQVVQAGAYRFFANPLHNWTWPGACYLLRGLWCCTRCRMRGSAQPNQTKVNCSPWGTFYKNNNNRFCLCKIR